MTSGKADTGRLPASLICAVALLLLFCGLSPAMAQQDAAATTDQQVAEETAGVEVAEIEALPRTRAARWAPMQAGYKRMTLHHPTLYYRSIQERRAFPDSIARSPGGRLCSGLYEIIQFPMQMALTPLLMLANPPWQAERAQP